MKLTALTVTTAAALAAMPAQAWWDNGHMLVGEIASQLMNPADVATIEKVLSKWDDEFPGTSKIATASIWPDLVKCNTKSAFCDTLALPSVPAMDKWHYVNLPLFTNGARWGNTEPDLTLFAQSWGGDAGDVVDQFIRTFNTSNSVWSVNLALRQVIHILGDVHNPMHAVGAVNENNLKGDSGGNNFTFPSPACVATNLHALYDSAGGDLINNWGEKYPLWDELKKNATDLIATLAIIEDGVDMKSIQDLSFAQFSTAFTRGSYFKKFILESYSVASTFVYPALDLTPIPGTRNASAHPTGTCCGRPRSASSASRSLASASPSCSRRSPSTSAPRRISNELASKMWQSTDWTHS